MKLSSRTALILVSVCVSSLAAGCADGGPGELPERVPPKYNAKSELIREVESGHNSFDFQL